VGNILAKSLASYFEKYLLIAENPPGLVASSEPIRAGGNLLGHVEFHSSLT
jgi:hypothetical protein